MESNNSLEMLSHPLTSVYGAYVITENGEPVFVESSIEMVAEMFENVTYAEASKIRVLIVSAECMEAPFDCTVFVWEWWVEKIADHIPDDYDDFTEKTGLRYGFIEFGYSEGYAEQAEKMRRNA